MNPLTTAGTAFAAFGLACFAQAADPAADKAPPTAPATTAGAAKPDAKALADAAAEAEANRMKVVFADRTRAVSAYFPKSQARIKVSAVTRFDPDMAKPREYFLFEMTGAAIVDPLVLDVEDAAAREALESPAISQEFVETGQLFFAGLAWLKRIQQRKNRRKNNYHNEAYHYGKPHQH